MPIVKTSLCRFSRGPHHKSGADRPMATERNFVAGAAGPAFGLCRAPMLSRNDVTALPGVSRYTDVAGDRLMQGWQGATRAILATMILCTAFGLGRAEAEP